MVIMVAIFIEYRCTITEIDCQFEASKEHMLQQTTARQKTDFMYLHKLFYGCFIFKKQTAGTD
jgi:hypothetical protein